MKHAGGCDDVMPREQPSRTVDLSLDIMTVHPTMASFNNGLCRFGGSFADPDRPRSCESPGVATDGRSVPASQRSSSRSGLAPGVVIDSQVCAATLSQADPRTPF